MDAGDGARAWRVLRQLRDYVEEWDRHAAAAPPIAVEPGPFAIRVQADTDRAAARFDLLAWQDPRDPDGPASPFWNQDGMAEARLDPAAPPLAEVVRDGGAVEGLRLAGGDLVVKVECRGAAVQFRIRDAPVMPADGGIAVVHAFGLRMPRSMRLLLDFWSAAGRTGPRIGREAREGTPGRTGFWQ